MGGDWCEDPKAGIGIDSHGDGEEMGYQGWTVVLYISTEVLH